MSAIGSSLLGFLKRGAMGSIFMRVLLLLLMLGTRSDATNECHFERSPSERPHSVSIIDFGAVGDGKTLNTLAFQNAVFYLKAFVDQGGAQLYIPPGRWLTGSFNLTSHLTLFLEKDAVILGSEDYSRWEAIKHFPSYGRDLNSPRKRYNSLISGFGLHDVVITGNNGTIDGQGYAWWESYSSHSSNYIRPNLLELVDSTDVVVSNVAFLNPPSWSIHIVYCNRILVGNVTVHAPLDSPHTNGIVPDSSENVCIGYSNVTGSHDAIVVRSGFDEYGLPYGKPTNNLQFKSLRLRSSSGAAIAFESEMLGGIFNTLVQDAQIQDSHTGIELRTTRARGGYIESLTLSNVEMDNVFVAMKATTEYGARPNTRPVVDSIAFENIVGRNVTVCGNFKGLHEAPFTSISLSNVTFLGSSQTCEWVCSNVAGFSNDVSPKPCPELMRGGLSIVGSRVRKGYRGIAKG